MPTVLKLGHSSGRSRPIGLVAFALVLGASTLLTREAVAADAPDLGDLGRPCDDNFFKPCPGDLVCVDYRCAVKTSTKAEKPKTEKAEQKAKARTSEPRAFRLGVQSGFWLGFAGKLQNPRPGFTTLADFGFPTGRRARFHVELGYEDLNDYTGFRIDPLVLGYEIPIYRGAVTLEVEIIAAIIQSEILFHDGFAIALSSGLRGQLVAIYGMGFLAFSPLGFEARYAYGLQDIGITTGIGANWPLVLTLGLEL